MVATIYIVVVNLKYSKVLMRGNWTSVGRMYLGREIPLFFLLFSNPHSSKTELEDDKTSPPFLATGAITIKSQSF
jgi:hypothetical protein